MAFPEAWMNELLSKNDIVSVISGYTELKPKGRRLWGLCPLHGEKTASFSVSPDKQLFYCFGCHAGGSVVQFIMDAERLPFTEAVQLLASRAGMELPQNVDDRQMQLERAHRERLYGALKSAARLFMETLLSDGGRPGREYLAARELSSEAVKRFGIGYAPDSWDTLMNRLQQEGYTRQELLDAGLLMYNQQKGRTYDAFRGRVMFPIIGTTGRVLGFGARVLDNTTPKYINTGDTPVYNKRNNLYGLNLMKGKKLDDLIMVEGYMDVIGLWEGGVTNAVASLGTALTVQQARLLKRYVSRVYIAYDGDAAGQNATVRGLDILKKEGLDVRVIVLPDGLDPDEYVRRRGPDAFHQLKDGALVLNAFKLDAMAREFNLSNENEREQYAKKGCAFIGSLEPVERDRLLERLARRTGYGVDELRAQSKVRASQPQGPAGGNVQNRFRTGVRREAPQHSPERLYAENTLLAAMLQSSIAAQKAAELGVLELLSQGVQPVAGRILTEWAMGKTPQPAAIVAELSSDAADRLSAALRRDETYSPDSTVVEDCAGRLKRLTAEETRAELNSRLTEPSLSGEQRDAILRQLQALCRGN